MRIPSLPPSVARLPFKRRQAEMQRAVNAELHSQNICPIMEYGAGNRDNTVGVYRDDIGRYWYTSANGEPNENKARWLEETAVDAIAALH